MPFRCIISRFARGPSEPILGDLLGARTHRRASQNAQRAQRLHDTDRRAWAQHEVAAPIGSACILVNVRQPDRQDQAPLGRVEGSTESATLVTDLIVDLRERARRTKPVLAAIDGSKAVRRAILDVFEHAVIHCCQLLNQNSCTGTGSRTELPHGARSSAGSTAATASGSTRASATSRPSSGRTSTVRPRPTWPRNQRDRSNGGNSRPIQISL